MLHLFIDTNVYLRFFGFSADEFEELRKAQAAITSGELKLWVTQLLLLPFGCEEFRDPVAIETRHEVGVLGHDVEVFAMRNLGEEALPVDRVAKRPLLAGWIAEIDAPPRRVDDPTRVARSSDAPLAVLDELIARVETSRDHHREEGTDGC